MAVDVGGLLLPEAAQQAFADNNTNKLPDLVTIKNGEPDIMFNKGSKLMKGMKRYVIKGIRYKTRLSEQFFKYVRNGYETV